MLGESCWESQVERESSWARQTGRVMLGESSWESHAGRVMGESSGSGRVMRWRCMGDARELANPEILVSRSNISFYSLGSDLHNLPRSSSARSADF